MTKVKIQSVQYEKSDTIEMQGTSADTKRYIRNGYFVKEERNGYWVLNKPSRVLAEILINNKPVLQNIKNEILNNNLSEVPSMEEIIEKIKIYYYKNIKEDNKLVF